jgi:hypothetical protein
LKTLNTLTGPIKPPQDFLPKGCGFLDDLEKAALGLKKLNKGEQEKATLDLGVVEVLKHERKCGKRSWVKTTQCTVNLVN